LLHTLSWISEFSEAHRNKLMEGVNQDRWLLRYQWQFVVS